MPNVRTFARSFAGGEVTPEFFGQIADAKYQTGLAACRNFIVMPHGPVSNRAGFEFVRAAKYAGKRVRLLPFTYSTTQTMVIELGDGYARFHTAGATLLAGTPSAWSGATAYVVGDLVLSGGAVYYCVLTHTNHAPPNATYWFALPSTAYEIPTPYTEADLFAIHYVQSADVLTLVHPNYAPRELRRLGATTWVLSTIAFATALAAPTGLGSVATPGATPGTPIDHTYAVTTVGADGVDESLISASTTCSNNLFDTGAYNTISWSAATGAKRYNVYKSSNGLWGYVGQADGLSFKDDNIVPDISNTPPESNNPFAAAGDYPGAVSYFEQRRCFGGTLNKPNNLWMTRSGTESNMTYSIPSRDSDSIAVRVVAREANTVRHLVPLTNLLALTSAAEWRVTSINTDAITPSSVSVKPQSYIGANNAQPVLVNNNLLYAAARGGHMRELAYNWQAGGYITGDLSLRAPHLFDGLDVVDLAYAKAPYPMLWAVSSTGALLGFTYVPEQQVGAWHRHDTAGAFESVACIAEGAEDSLYAVVRRTIGGATVRYVERLRSRAFAEAADAFFVDCGLSYSGAATMTFSGLAHLEGQTVSVLADGAVHAPRVVSGGTITLDHAASKVHAGLPITADLQTLPLAIEVAGFAQGRTKNVNKAFLRVHRSSGIFAGPSFDLLVEAKQRTTEPYGSPPSLKTDEIEIVVRPSWTDSGQVCIRQADPLPLTVVSMALDVAIGG